MFTITYSFKKLNKFMGNTAKFNWTTTHLLQGEKKTLIIMIEEILEFEAKSWR